MLASDAFDRFENEGIFNTQTGKEFRQAILAVGGKDTALEAFVNFRGREPKLMHCYVIKVGRTITKPLKLWA